MRLRARFAIAPDASRKEWRFNSGMISLMHPHETANWMFRENMYVLVSA